MGCKTGQVLASGSRCPLTSRFYPKIYGEWTMLYQSRWGKKKKKTWWYTKKNVENLEKARNQKHIAVKDFETRKTSKNYNSKRWKRMTGRRTRRAPLFPWA